MKFRLAALYGVGFIAVMLPILTAIFLAEYKSVLSQQERANALATEILLRADKVSAQLGVVFAELARAPQGEPCAEQNLNLMRRLVVQSNLLVDVGFVEGEQMACSSFGRNGYHIGPKSYTGDKGNQVWTQVEHPLLPGSRLLIVVDPKTGFAALIHGGAVLDAAPADSKLVFGVLGVSRRKEIFSHGPFAPQWLARIGGSYDASFFDGAHAVAWKRSKQSDYAAYAAVPSSEIDDDWKRVLWVLLPIGICAAVVLAFVVTQLVRLQGALPAALRHALKHGGFSLVYQPIVDLRSGVWVGAEALLRWRKEDGNFVSPDIFIPIAEKSQLIERVTQRVIELFESEAAELLRQNPNFYIAINLSAHDFSNPGLCERLRAAAAKMQVHTRRIHVEATERVFLHVEETRKAVDALRAQGHSVAIDDFGTGYSSLSYLTELKLDCLKIDRCFVSTIGQQAVTSHVIGHIIEMAKSLELKMTAEGIETEPQASYLRARGVQFGQGWLFAKPMDITQLVTKLSERHL